MATKETQLVDKDQFEAYAVGLCYASACASLTDEDQIVLNMNASHPTGISTRWEIAKDKKFKTGQSNPCPCDKRPSTHKHYLFTC